MEYVIIGAGMIGLACARALALLGKEVIVLERAPTFGTETSSRNSDVIHAGIYNPPGSLKAKLCVEGKQKIYDYCQDNDIVHKKIGKLIVASQESEIEKLYELQQNAIANEILDLEFLNAQQLKILEPNIIGVAALFSPSSGILDTANYMASLLQDARQQGAQLLVNTKVISGAVLNENIRLNVMDNGNMKQLYSKNVINCAGIYASQVSHSIQGLPIEQVPTTYYRKGNYFSYNAASPFSHLIYPIPVPGGLGTHGTIDLQGQVRFGPDVEWIETIDYSVDPARGPLFSQAISKYCSTLKIQSLQPSYSGIRASLADINGGFKDFSIMTHKLENSSAKLTALYGIESPGLTASLSIADYVTGII